MLFLDLWCLVSWDDLLLSSKEVVGDSEYVLISKQREEFACSYIINHKHIYHIEFGKWW